MSKANDLVLPGEHSHSDRPNWRPAETVEEYLSNIAEGLERYSVERMTKMLGLNRTQAWRTGEPQANLSELFRPVFGAAHAALLDLGSRAAKIIEQWINDGNAPLNDFIYA